MCRCRIVQPFPFKAKYTLPEYVLCIALCIALKTTRSMKNWYGIYTKINCEKKVADLLNRKKMEAYFPVTSTDGKWIWRRNMSQPLFLSYVFVKVTQEQLEEVRKLPGVINLLFWLGQPVVIKDSEIEAIKTLVQENSDVVVKKFSLDAQLIAEGPAIFYSRYNGSKILNLRLPSIGYIISVKVETPKIKVIQLLQKNIPVTPSSDYLMLR